MINKQKINRLNQLGKEKRPFLFIVDFDIKNFYIFCASPLEKLKNNQIYFAIDGFSNVTSPDYLDYINKEPHYSFHLKKKRSILADTPLLSTALSRK